MGCLQMVIDESELIIGLKNIYKIDFCHLPVYKRYYEVIGYLFRPPEEVKRIPTIRTIDQTL